MAISMGTCTSFGANSAQTTMNVSIAASSYDFTLTEEIGMHFPKDGVAADSVDNLVVTNNLDSGHITETINLVNGATWTAKDYSTDWAKEKANSKSFGIQADGSVDLSTTVGSDGYLANESIGPNESNTTLFAAKIPQQLMASEEELGQIVVTVNWVKAAEPTIEMPAKPKANKPLAKYKAHFVYIQKKTYRKEKENMASIKTLKKETLITLCYTAGLEASAKETKKELMDKLTASGITTDDILTSKDALKKEAEKNPKVATAEKKSERTFRDGKTMLRVNPEDRYAPLQTAEDEAYEKLIGSMRSLKAGIPRYLRGVLTKIEPRRNKNGLIYYYACVNYGGYQVKIIHPWFFLEEPKTPEEAKIFLENRLGSEIDFIVTDIDSINGNEFFYASRTLAAELMRRQFWYGKLSNGKDRIKENSIVEARVIWTSKLVIGVEVFGVEIRININEISHGYEYDARKIEGLKVGAVTPIYIKKILKSENPEKEGYPVKVYANISDALPNPQQKYFNEYHVGDIVLGTVMNKIVTPTQMAAFVKCEDKIEVYATYEVLIHGSPQQGDKCFVKITKKDSKSCRFWGNVERLL